MPDKKNDCATLLAAWQQDLTLACVQVLPMGHIKDLK
jgi:hypothetical protein